MTVLYPKKYRACAFFFGVLLCLQVMAPAGSVPIGAAQDLPEDLTELSLEELINIEVVSAAKKTQPLSETDAAVFVITQADIARSGATSIPEALRMAPGLQVARIDANKWAISARGFNGRFANKLLVLVDGRSVYSPVFSGVFWDTVDTLMEDIDRIEVIRGPGATLWGANAVNGVINIITKKAEKTQGALITGGAGTKETGSGSVRYGGTAGEESYYRIYAKYFDRDSGLLASGQDGSDAWKGLRAGFRIDRSDLVTFEGEIYDETAGTDINISGISFTDRESENSMTGGHLLGLWNYSPSEGHALTFQAYYDRSETDLIYLDAAICTTDVEFTHRFSTNDLWELAWGLGYRFFHDDITSRMDFIEISSQTDDYHIASGFVQGVVYLLDQRLRLTAGTKLEHNDFTGFEVQPSLRFLWAPKNTYSLWGAVSRAVRTPLRLEKELHYNPGAFDPGTLQETDTSTQTVSSEETPEELLAYELGVRKQVAERLSIDLATFYNLYRELKFGRLITPDTDSSAPPDEGSTPFTIDNSKEAETFGAELSADFLVSERWSLQAAYSYLHIRITDGAPSNSGDSEKSVAGSSPRHEASLRIGWNPFRNTTLDTWLRYVDSLDYQDVDSYVTADLRLAFEITEGLEVAVTGQNLLAPSHSEFVPQFVPTVSTETERSVYGKMVWQF